MRSFRNGFRFTALTSVSIGLLACSGNGLNGLSAPSAGGDTIALTNNNRIISFNQASPSIQRAVAVTGLQPSETLLGIDIRPADGVAYGLGSTGRIYTIGIVSGVATVKSTLAADTTDTTAPFTMLNGVNFGVDFNPVVDRMRVVSDTGQNLRINVDTGATITDGNLSGPGAATRTGITEAGYINSFSAACRTTLFFLDTTNNRLVVTNDPNNGTTTDVGNLGVTASAIAGFEIVTGSSGTNTAIAALTVGNTPTIYTINLNNGAATPNGAITGLATGEVIRGLAISPPTTAPTQTAGNVVGVTASSKLISFNNASPQKLCTSAAITGLNSGETVLGVDVRPANGQLYALTSAARLLTINPNTAVASPAVTLAADGTDLTLPFTALSGTEFGVDFNPTVDRLRIVSDAGQNLRVNVDSGATITDTNLNPAGAAVTAAAYTNSFQGAGTTTLYVLDTAADQLVIQGGTSGSPNNGDLAPVGNLGLDTGAVASFEINAINNTALAAVTLPGATTSDLDTVDLSMGTATRVNTIGGGEPVRSIAFNINPVPQVMALTGDGQLVSFKLQTSGTFDTAFPVTGLQSGENLLGIDYRPANGKLYGVTDQNNLYTLDPTNGGATLVKMLIPDPNDTTAPFTVLPTGGTFGVDFNPMADRLRVVSSTGANLRINVDTGAVTTDTNLTTATALVTGAAYTQNFAAAPATQLFDLDSASGTLLLQAPPNDGALTLVGTTNLGVTFSAVGGFDIVGGANGLAIAALQTTAGGPSALYRINLTAGTAAVLDATTTSIGPAGTVITALTTRLQ